jgi:hypothetical protein
MLREAHARVARAAPPPVKRARRRDGPRARGVDGGGRRGATRRRTDRGRAASTPAAGEARRGVLCVTAAVRCIIIVISKGMKPG